jgi:hypothetical protein
MRHLNYFMCDVFVSQVIEEAVPSGLNSLGWEVGRAREGVAARLGLALSCGLTATLLLAFLTLFLPVLLILKIAS